MSRLDICRDDLLILLASMGVVLPKSTKIPDEALNKRVSQALDAAQQISVLINPTLVNPSIYELWSLDKTLLDATQRGNMLESFRNRISPGTKGVSSAKEDTFKELRQIIMAFAFTLEANHCRFCLMDTSAPDWGVYVRIVNVYKVTDKTPFFLLVYKEVHSTPDYSLTETLRALNDSDDDSDLVYWVQSTALERRAMLRLFHLNSKRLSSEGYTICEHETSKFGFRTSFVLPLGPLSMLERGRLTNNSGCEVCGNINISRCNQCLSVAYCSKECQKADWKNHKATCYSLKGGTWQTITFDPCALSEGGFKAIAIINRLDPNHNPPRIEALTPREPPPNIHDNKIFLVKLQISLFKFRDEAHFLIYDRQKSFQVFWRRKDGCDLFDEAEDILGDELKMYRWARRLGEYDLGICLDRAPAQNPAW